MHPITIIRLPSKFPQFAESRSADYTRFAYPSPTSSLQYPNRKIKLLTSAPHSENPGYTSVRGVQGKIQVVNVRIRLYQILFAHPHCWSGPRSSRSSPLSAFRPLRTRQHFSTASSLYRRHPVHAFQSCLFACVLCTLRQFRC